MAGYSVRGEPKKEALPLHRGPQSTGGGVNASQAGILANKDPEGHSRLGPPPPPRTCHLDWRTRGWFSRCHLASIVGTQLLPAAGIWVLRGAQAQACQPREQELSAALSHCCPSCVHARKRK